MQTPAYKEGPEFISSIDVVNVKVKHRASKIAISSMIETSSDNPFVLVSANEPRDLSEEPRGGQRPGLPKELADSSPAQIEVVDEDPLETDNRSPNPYMRHEIREDENSQPEFESQVVSTFLQQSPGPAQVVDRMGFTDFRATYTPTVAKNTGQAEDGFIPVKPESTEIPAATFEEAYPAPKKQSVIETCNARVSSFSFRESIPRQSRPDAFKEVVPYYHQGPAIQTDQKRAPHHLLPTSAFSAKQPRGHQVPNRVQIDLLPPEDSEEQTVENFNCQVSLSSRQEMRIREPLGSKQPCPSPSRNAIVTSDEFYETSNENLIKKSSKAQIKQPEVAINLIKDSQQARLVLHQPEANQNISKLFEESKHQPTEESNLNATKESEEVPDRAMIKASPNRKNKQGKSQQVFASAPEMAVGQSLVTFAKPCQVSYQRTRDGTPSPAAPRYVTYQSNYKLIIFSAGTGGLANPLAPTDSMFIDKVHTHRGCSDKMLPYAIRHYHKNEYLMALKQVGSIEQTNVCSSCHPEFVLDLGLLASGKIFNDPLESLQDKPLVQLSRDELFENPDEAVTMNIDLYSAYRTLAQRNFGPQAKRAASSKRRKEVELLNAEKHFRMRVTLTFKDYGSMITLYQALEDLLEQQQDDRYHLHRLNQDEGFWKNIRAYQLLQTSQGESWRFNSISEEHFLKNVDTGDIILFRTNSQRAPGSWMTRKMTGSHFDHIGLVIRLGDSLKELFLMEAVNLGVRMISWINIRDGLHPGGFFEKIVTRKLLCDMTVERLSRLEKFKKNTLGHSYGLSTWKIIFGARSFVDGDDHSEIEEGRKFFCSELVAKAFKALNVIHDPQERSSCNFYPGSFAPREFGGEIDNIMAPKTALGPALNILVNSDRAYNPKIILTTLRQTSSLCDVRPSRVSSQTLKRRENTQRTETSMFVDKHYYCKELSAEEISYGNEHNCWL